MVDDMSDKMSDAQRAGMTEAEFAALSPDAREWRLKHPRPAAPVDALSGLGRDVSDVSDRPGHAPEEAAPSGVLPAATPGLSPAGQGAQVILTGDAQAAARGGLHGDIVKNTEARDRAIEAGHVVSGTTAEAADNATATAGLDDEADARARTAADTSRDRAQAAEKAKRTP